MMTTSDAGPNRQYEEKGQKGTVTQALESASGTSADYSEAMDLVYPELLSMARYYLRSEREDHTLDTRALVHEAYMRLASQAGIVWKNRRHFFGTAAQHMRRILCDYARKHGAEKRGGALLRVRLQGMDDLTGPDSGSLSLEELLSLDQALDRLKKRDPEASEIVNLRSFLGLNMSEISKETGIPIRTLSRKWRWIRAWLYSELHERESQHLM